jgi:hypothetical protein
MIVRRGQGDLRPSRAIENSGMARHIRTMVNFVANLTTEAACDALRGAGVTCSPEDVQIAARDERWAVSLPGECIAWFPASPLGNRRLAIERRPRNQQLAAARRGWPIGAAVARAAGSKERGESAHQRFSLSDQGLVQVLEAAVTGLDPGKPYLLALAAEPSGTGVLEPLQSFMTCWGSRR